MNCPICSTPFDLADHLPKKLPSHYSVCAVCISAWLSDGQVPPPYSTDLQSISDLATLPNSLTYYTKLREMAIRCVDHPEKPAFYFCCTHLKPLCKKCSCERSMECEPAEMRERDKIRFYLVKAIKERDRRYLPPDLTAQCKNPYGRDLFDLFDIVMRITDLYRAVLCDVCEKPTAQWIGLKDVRGYCQECYQRAAAEDASLQVVSLADDIETVKRRIHAAVVDSMRFVDFYNITLVDVSWLQKPPKDLKLFLSEGKATASRRNLPQLGEEGLPLEFWCPWCRLVIKKSKNVSIQLPCTEAFHVACKSCCADMGREIECPIDKRRFEANGSTEESGAKPS